jgi:hypothetical protein
MAERPLTQEMLDRRSYGQGSRARFDPQWAMSRPSDWYQDRNNLSLIKDTLVRQPAVTTDPNESRNMYQMLMNQMKGGDRGARLIDTSGLPAGARRIGRTLFTDPAKSQGFFGDVGSLFTRNNKAAVYADEYNPFPPAGFGSEFYKKEFPYASGLGSLMGAAENFIPYFGMAKRMLSKERTPLERDTRFLPENNMAPFWELLEDEVEDTPLDYDWNDLWMTDKEDDLSYEPETVWGPEGDPSIIMAGMEPEDITEKIVEEGVKDVDEPVVDEFKIFENPEIFNNVFAFPEQTGFINFASAFDSPWNVFESAKEKMSGKTDQEILDLLVKRGFLIDNTLEEE